MHVERYRFSGLYKTQWETRMVECITGISWHTSVEL